MNLPRIASTKAMEAQQMENLKLLRIMLPITAPLINLLKNHQTTCRLVQLARQEQETKRSRI
jgi:hypothetical protein